MRCSAQIMGGGYVRLSCFLQEGHDGEHDPNPRTHPAPSPPEREKRGPFCNSCCYQREDGSVHHAHPPAPSREPAKCKHGFSDSRCLVKSCIGLPEPAKECEEAREGGWKCSDSNMWACCGAEGGDPCVCSCHRRPAIEINPAPEPAPGGERCESCKTWEANFRAFVKMEKDFRARIASLTAEREKADAYRIELEENIGRRGEEISRLTAERDALAAELTRVNTLRELGQRHDARMIEELEAERDAALKREEKLRWLTGQAVPYVHEKEHVGDLVDEDCKWQDCDVDFCVETRAALAASGVADTGEEAAHADHSKEGGE